MTVKTRSQLTAQFDEIRNEAVAGANTKERIADAHQDTLDSVLVGVNGAAATGIATGATILAPITEGVATLDVDPDRVLTVYRTWTVMIASLASGVASSSGTITIPGLVPYCVYQATIGVRASVYREGFTETAARPELVQDISFITDGFGVATLELTHVAVPDTTKCTAIPSASLAIAKATGGFSVSVSQASGNTCKAVLQIRLADLVLTP